MKPAWILACRASIVHSFYDEIKSKIALCSFKNIKLPKQLISCSVSTI